MTAPVRSAPSVLPATFIVEEPLLSVKHWTPVMVIVDPVVFLHVLLRYVPAVVAFSPSPNPGWQLHLLLPPPDPQAEPESTVVHTPLVLVGCPQ